MAVLAAAVVAYGFSRTIDQGLIHTSFVIPLILYVHVALPIVGIWVSIVMARIEAQQGDAHAGPFLAIPFADMLFFAMLFGLGVWYRRSAETHRRLMLMAALSLTGAGFGRFPSFIVPHGGWFYLAVDVMIFAGIARDLIVQRRVHRVYQIGVPLLMMGQLLAIWIRYSDWWAVMSQGLLRS